jgi:ATP-binding cassette subfamily F protein 3
MLTFEDVSLRRGPRLLIEHAAFAIAAGDKVGLTGANGTGKSSLIALIRGEIEPDAGTFELTRGTVVAHVAQDVADSEAAAIDHVIDGDAELRATERSLAAAEARGDGAAIGELHAKFAAIGGHEATSRAARLMHGLGFAPEDCRRPVMTFSGGWRVRLALARALMCRSDLLLLDEPTNHLDLDAIGWLEQWLASYAGTLLVIAHDREFLDNVVGRIAHIEAGVITLYSGNYSDFEHARAERLARQQALYVRQQREVARLERFVERFRAKASKARQAQSRIKALERMERIAIAHVDSPFDFVFESSGQLASPLLVLDDLRASYDERVVVDHVDLSIAPGDRIALLGRNGAGKSSVLRLIAGQLASVQGQRIEARELTIGYFAQLDLEQLEPRESPLDHLRRLGSGAAAADGEQLLRTHLGGFGFTGNRVFEPVGTFSGGERARLVLAVLAHRRPELLVLDEPTNHLDLEMRQALAVALQEYAGAVVLVSHDRYLLRVLADRLYVVADGGMREFDGDLSDYERSLRATAATASAAEPAARSGRRDARRLEADRRARLRPLKSEIERLEAQIERWSRAVGEIDADLADPDTYGPAADTRPVELLRSRARLETQIAAAEGAWLAAHEALEEALRREARDQLLQGDGREALK